MSTNAGGSKRLVAVLEHAQRLLKPVEIAAPFNLPAQGAKVVGVGVKCAAKDGLVLIKIVLKTRNRDEQTSLWFRQAMKRCRTTIKEGDVQIHGTLLDPVEQDTAQGVLEKYQIQLTISGPEIREDARQLLEFANTAGTIDEFSNAIMQQLGQQGSVVAVTAAAPDTVTALPVDLVPQAAEAQAVATAPNEDGSRAAGDGSAESPAPAEAAAQNPPVPEVVDESAIQALLGDEAGKAAYILTLANHKAWTRAEAPWFQHGDVVARPSSKEGRPGLEFKLRKHDNGGGFWMLESKKSKAASKSGGGGLFGWFGKKK